MGIIALGESAFCRRYYVVVVEERTGCTLGESDMGDADGDHNEVVRSGNILVRLHSTTSLTVRRGLVAVVANDLRTLDPKILQSDKRSLT